MKVENSLRGLAAWICLLLLGGTASLAELRPDVVIADFESPDYGSWTTTGEAFGKAPVRGTLPGQMKVGGFLGKGLANSFHHGDRSTGTLTSPPFEITRRYINFLIGGGGYAEETFMELEVDGKVARTARGTNIKPGGSEDLAWQSWDVSDLAGQTAIIRIVDRRQGGWGHINVDQILLTDRKPPQLLKDAEREFKIDKHYLNFPIKNGAPKREVTLLIGDQAEVVNTIELADANPDWWGFMDVSAFHGKAVTVRVDRLPEDSQALGTIDQSDAVKDAGNLYNETLRPQFHFSSRRGRLNDPNGLSFYKGEYHLFYQHNPYGWAWGNMHWGHAVSSDMVHWQELDVALAPDRFGPMYSGSAVVDWNNTMGLGPDGLPAQALIYTAAGHPSVQCLAIGRDGRHFTKFSDNPILKQITHGNRDPKVIWHEPTKRWIMVLYVTLPERKHTIHFFTSPNLREWALASITEGGTDRDHYLYECPDFFELPLDGQGTNQKWVLSAANSEYAVGTFDGTSFTPEAVRLTGRYGSAYYAPQTFSDEPRGRRIQIGWMRAPIPGMPFNQCMSVPQELHLVSTLRGPRISRFPIKELESLRIKAHHIPSLTLRPESANPLGDLKAELVELDAEFAPGNAETVFTVRGATIAYNAQKQELDVNGVQVPAPLRQGRQRLRVFCDRTTLEVFASDGLVYVPLAFQAEAANPNLGIQAKGGSTRFAALNVYELGSAWKSEAPGVRAR